MTLFDIMLHCIIDSFGWSSVKVYQKLCYANYLFAQYDFYKLDIFWKCYDEIIIKHNTNMTLVLRYVLHNIIIHDFTNFGFNKTVKRINTI